MMFAFSNCSKSKAGAFVIAAATLRLVGILLLQSSAAMANVGSAAPPGSYQQSCTSISYSANGVLTASCDKSEPEGYCGQPFCPGVSSPAQIYVPACQPGVDIANINGHLQCIAKTGHLGRRARHSAWELPQFLPEFLCLQE